MGLGPETLSDREIKSAHSPLLALILLCLYLYLSVSIISISIVHLVVKCIVFSLATLMTPDATGTSVWGPLLRSVTGTWYSIYSLETNNQYSVQHSYCELGNII